MLDIARSRSSLYVRMASGKSFISHKISNFLSWCVCRLACVCSLDKLLLLVRSHQHPPTHPRRLGVRASIFNVGSLRRKVAQGKQSFDFFDAANVAAKQQREELAYSALDMALEWLGACVRMLRERYERQRRRSDAVCGTRSERWGSGDL